MATFRDDAMQPDTGFAENPPRTYRYWEMVPQAAHSVLVHYGDDGKRPALLEPALDRKKYRGRVLLFTTPFDDRRDARDRPWNDYAEWWFYVALTNRAVRYVGGATEEVEYNHIAGRMITITLPPSIRGTALNLTGPGLSGPDSLVSRPERQQEVRLLQARTAGNYQLSTADGSWKTAFSVNAAARGVSTSAACAGRDSRRVVWCEFGSQAGRITVQRQARSAFSTTGRAISLDHASHSRVVRW